MQERPRLKMQALLGSWKTRVAESVPHGAQKTRGTAGDRDRPEREAERGVLVEGPGGGCPVASGEAQRGGLARAALITLRGCGVEAQSLVVRPEWLRGNSTDPGPNSDTPRKPCLGCALFAHGLQEAAGLFSPSL